MKKSFASRLWVFFIFFMENYTHFFDYCQISMKKLPSCCFTVNLFLILRRINLAKNLGRPHGISRDRSCLIESGYAGFLPNPRLAHRGHNIAGNLVPVCICIEDKRDRWLNRIRYHRCNGRRKPPLEHDSCWIALLNAAWYQFPNSSAHWK